MRRKEENILTTKAEKQQTADSTEYISYKQMKEWNLFGILNQVLQKPIK
jgi:hypothetical protein